MMDGVRGRLAAWFETAGDYRLTRVLLLRLLALVYVAAFAGLLVQGNGLLGSHGLLPAHLYLRQLREQGMTFADVPSIFWLTGASDGDLLAWAWIGLGLSALALCGLHNLPVWALLWAIYGSYVRIGQRWFSFGWEIQILETTVLAALLAHPWKLRDWRAEPPPLLAVVLFRWLTFRIMLGAGLIKWRGDPCWRELTCLDYHFATQPIPNPLSPLFHGLPHWALAGGVLFNHAVELALPWCVFGPRPLRLLAGLLMAAFQLALVCSGNLAFLNWLTLVPILACLDDRFALWLLRGRWRQRALDWLGEPQRPVRGQRIAVAILAALVAWRSVPVVDNLLSDDQAMNQSYDPLAFVNTYGAFGSVGDTRHELVIEGTDDAVPADDGHWLPYELPCKPGDPSRRPCLLGPYHLRLDWLMWFAAMRETPADPWLAHLVHKLLLGEPAVKPLLGRDPFASAPPKWVRIRRFVYEMAPLGSPAWWRRSAGQVWLQPVSLESENLREFLRRRGFL